VETPSDDESIFEEVHQFVSNLDSEGFMYLKAYLEAIYEMDAQDD